MLDAYLGDISMRLDAGQWDDAQRLAIGLPHIAVALGAEDLTTSRERYIAWCTDWVAPDQGNDRYTQWATASMENAADFAEGRPVRLLQDLGLKRRLRTSPPYLPAPEAHDAHGKTVMQDCQLLTFAFEAWRNRAAADENQTVLLNLVKVGVLR
jgi:hypothetical protein